MFTPILQKWKLTENRSLMYSYTFAMRPVLSKWSSTGTAPRILKVSRGDCSNTRDLPTGLSHWQRGQVDRRTIFTVPSGPSCYRETIILLRFIHIACDFRQYIVVFTHKTALAGGGTTHNSRLMWLVNGPRRSHDLVWERDQPVAVQEWYLVLQRRGFLRKLLWKFRYRTVRSEAI